MLYKLKWFLAVTLTISFSIATAQEIIAPEGQKLTYTTRSEINQLIERKAFVYSVNPIIMSRIIMCESSFNVNAQNISPRERSYGLVQVNTMAHDISIEQAKDPEFAVDFLAKNLKNGKADDMWVTCYKKATGV